MGDVKKAVVDELIQAGGTLYLEMRYTEAQVIWERALLLAQTPEQVNKLNQMVASVRTKQDDGAEHQPIPEGEMKTFDDIIGAEREKAEIVREFMRYHKYPHLYVQGKAMLLYGPPGTGKTLIAKGIASAFNMSTAFQGRTVHLFAASGADLKGKYYGETEKNIKSWFVSAQTLAQKNNSVSVLFLDEFESLAPNRQGPMASSAGSSSVTALLQFIDGMAAFNRVILLAATNGPWELDSAVKRRFTSTLFVDLPSDETRATLIATLIGKRLTTDFRGGWMDAFSLWAAGLMGASEAISKREGLDHFLTASKRVTRTGLFPLGYSLSDVTHAVNSALNMLAEKLIVQPQTDTGGKTCYFEVPSECEACIECTHRNGADLYLTLDHMFRHGKQTFLDAVAKYPSSIDVDEYAQFVRYYQDPNQFHAKIPKKRTQRKKTE